MTSKERILATLEFRKPDRIPKCLWVLGTANMKYGKDRINALIDKYGVDIYGVSGPQDHGWCPEYYRKGRFVDPWGSEWNNLQDGMLGEVKNPIFDDISRLDGYVSPKDKFIEEWEEAAPDIADRIAQGRAQGKFITGGWMSIFERLQYLRGTENLYCDIALEEECLDQMIEIVMDYYRTYIDKWLEMDIDAMIFGDDWGTQISLLISPVTWRKVFKPLYQELIDKIKAAGKKVFFHCDGYILELYPDFIEMGVDAINSQLWCMGVEKIAEQFAGKITFWGELSRQETLPNGTPADVQACADKMKRYLYKDGGLIGQCEVGSDVPFENIEASLAAW